MATANDSYKEQAQNINNQIAELQALLAKHAAEQSGSPRNWGFVGDLGAISRNLNDTIAFLKGEDE